MSERTPSHPHRTSSSPTQNAKRSPTMQRISVPPFVVAIATLLLAVAMLLLPFGAYGQSRSQRGFFVAIPDAYPAIDARAVIIREPGKEVLLLRAGEATPEVLAMGLVTLRRVRRDNPTLRQGEMIPLVNFVITREMTPEYRERMEAVLSRLRGRPTTNVGNLGPGRWVRYRDGKR